MARYTCALCSTVIRKNRREVFTCSTCHLAICGDHAVQYVDEANVAITRNSPVFCIRCKPPVRYARRNGVIS